MAGEVRELERRVRARLTPAFPLEVRRKLPLELRLAALPRSSRCATAPTVVDEYGPRSAASTARSSRLLDFLYRRYFRVAVQGLEQHPRRTGAPSWSPTTPAPCPTTRSMLMHAVEREHPAAPPGPRRCSRTSVFHFPYLGTFINRIGGVRACPENAERLLAEEQLVAVFPEGIKGIGKLYRDRYRLQRFGRGGFIKLALRTGSPIIPVAVVGAEEATPMLAQVTWLAARSGLPHLPITPTFPLLGPAGLLPLPSKWLVRFGEPIDLAPRARRRGRRRPPPGRPLAETVAPTDPGDD